MPNIEKQTVYFSVAISRIYKKETKTYWINSLVAHGKVAYFIKKHAKAGSQVFLSGDVIPIKKGEHQAYYFVVTKFRILRKAKSQANDDAQQKAVDNLPDEENYNTYENDNEDLPY